MSPLPAPLPDSSARLRRLPLWVGLAGLALTAALGGWWHQRESAQRRVAMEGELATLARALEHQVQGYLDTLPGLRVYGMLRQAPSDAEFLQYVQAISLEDRYPGLAVTFMAEKVAAAERPAFEARVRQDRSVRAEGHPAFAVTPPGARPDHMVLRHLHPEDPPAFGYDLFDPAQAYRADVERAIDGGAYVATGPLQLARDRDRAPDPALTSIVVRAALYRGGITPAALQARQAAAIGVVGIGFRIQPLVHSVLGPELARGFRLRLVDEAARAGPTRGLLYDSAPGQAVPEQPPAWQGDIPVADRRWTLSAHPRVQRLAFEDSTAVLLLFGAGLSLALAALTRGLVRSNLQAGADLRRATQALVQERDQLRLSEARVRMLFENSFDAVLRTRPDGTVLEGNAAAAALFRASPQQLQQLTRGQLVDTTDPRLAVLLAERQRTGRAAGCMRMRRADGSLFEAEISSNTYVDGDGQPSSSMIIRDVTERQRLAERLQEKQRLEAIGTLAGGVAHDFNNMLAAILGNLALAARELPAGSPAQERLQLAHRAGNRARQLVRQVLTFSRRAPREHKVQAVQPLVDEAIGLLRATLPPTVRLVVQRADRPLWLRVDGAQMQQLVLNLCTNAWQALPEESGEVLLSLQHCTLDAEEARLLGLAPGAHACLHVADDGEGMTAEVRSRMFEPFFTTKPPGRGTGLGLAVVHGVVSESGGAIRVDSAPGQGTRISVYLPLVDRGEDSAAAEANPRGPETLPGALAEAQEGASGAVPGRLLYIDDDEVVALTAMALLRRAGHEVQWAASGDAALALLAESAAGPGPGIDLVITDFHMPGLSGLAVAEAVHQVLPGLPVILTSGHVTDELQQRAAALQVQEVLPKEEMLERLPAAVQRALVARG